MHRKSSVNGALYALAAAVLVGLLGAMLGLAPWIIIMVMAFVVIGAWVVAANGMSGSP